MSDSKEHLLWTSAPAADYTPRPRRFVLQDWVGDLPLQMQGVLVCALRGPDNAPKECTAKEITRALRSVVMNKARPFDERNSFCGDGSYRVSPEVLRSFFRDHDQYPHHWYMHLVHAAEIVGYSHTVQLVSAFWLQVYYKACEDLHMKPEDFQTFWDRLGADGDPEYDDAAVVYGADGRPRIDGVEKFRGCGKESGTW